MEGTPSNISASVERTTVVNYTASASTLESLSPRDTEQDSFTYAVSDGTNITEATVEVTIQGGERCSRCSQGCRPSPRKRR